MKKLLVTGYLLLACLAFPAFAGDKPKVVASFSIIADMTREVAGDTIELTTLVGVNGDAHEYQPTPSDAKTIAEADLVLINGLGFEGWMERLIQSSGYKGKVVVVSDGIKPIATSKDEHNHDHDHHHHSNIDPHAWQDISNGQIYIENIKNALRQIDKSPDKKNSVEYVKNAALYKQKLAELDGWVKYEFAKIAPEKRVVISTHDAFAYFAAAYGVQFVSAMGVNTSAQASAADIARLIDQINAKKINILFFENMTDQRLIEQLQKDTGAITGGTLYSDSLSAEDEPAATYINMFKHNVGELVKAMKYEKK